MVVSPLEESIVIELTRNRVRTVARRALKHDAPF